MPSLRARSACLVALGFGVLATACFEDPGTVSGEVDAKNKFRYACDDSAAVGACTGTADSFPRAVARGARFRLTIDGTTPLGVVKLAPISEEVVGTGPDGTWVCSTGGTAGFVAFDSRGNVVDYVHIPVEIPTRLAFAKYERGLFTAFDRDNGTDTTRLDLTAGQRVLVAAKPYGSGTGPLAGMVAYAFSVDKPDTVKVESTGTASGPSAFVWLTGGAAGTARLRVEGAGLSTELEVVVR